MNKPAFSQYLLGHRVTVLAALLLAAFASYRWLTQQEHHEDISWLVPAVALLLCKSSFRARTRISEFTQWNGAWNAMAGGPERVGGDAKARAPRRPRSPLVRFVLLAVTSLACLSWLSVHAHESGSPEYAGVAVAFVAASAWGAWIPAASLLRWAWSPSGVSARARGAGHFVVSQCLRIPRMSPGLGAVRAALPDYCQTLLLARAADPPQGGEPRPRAPTNDAPPPDARGSETATPE